MTTSTGLWFEEFRDSGVPMIGITGSKGKTTTTMLIAHLLRRLGERIEVAGNIGRPVALITDLSETDRVVLELSSYQITDLSSGPQIVVFTNIFREHLDWHNGFDNYVADKLRLASLPGAQQIAINSEDARLRAIETGAEVHHYLGEGRITVVGSDVMRGDQVLLTEDDFVMPGRHNLGNVAAALTAVELAGYDCSDAAELLADFVPPRHRLELAAQRDGVIWVDDNYSSTPESAVAALESFPGPAVLIVGGRFRDQDHMPLVVYLRTRDDVHVIGIEDSGEVLLALAGEFGFEAPAVTTGGTCRRPSSWPHNLQMLRRR